LQKPTRFLVAGVGFATRQSRVSTVRTVRIVVFYRLGTLGSADFLLGGVNRRKNDYQSFFLRLQVIRPNPEGTRSKSADREAQIPRNSRSEKRKNTPQWCVFFSG
jgi:hypothetical protein